MSVCLLPPVNLSLKEQIQPTSREGRQHLCPVLNQTEFGVNTTAVSRIINKNTNSEIVDKKSDESKDRLRIE
jgi:hypothetical protein